MLSLPRFIKLWVMCILLISGLSCSNRDGRFRGRCKLWLKQMDNTSNNSSLSGQWTNDQLGNFMQYLVRRPWSFSADDCILIICLMVCPNTAKRRMSNISVLSVCVIFSYLGSIRINYDNLLRDIDFCCMCVTLCPIISSVYTEVSNGCRVYRFLLPCTLFIIIIIV